MRFEALELIRYGGYADHRIAFGSGHGTDLHLIVGPNEAGKSTMLQAIGDLLFGMPAQTTQNWRYDYNELRIRALIAHDGGLLDVTRRKGNRNTLLAADGTPLADTSLEALLGGIDRRAFERMFGLDHQKLRDGGEAILQGKDDAARIVLEAGTGIGGIGAALKRFEGQAAALFKPSAQNPPINRLMRERQDALAMVRTTAISDADWRAVRARLAEAEAGKSALVAEATALAARAHALQRIGRVRPLLARLAAARTALLALGDVVAMADDAAEVLAAARAERATAQALAQAEAAKRDHAAAARSAMTLPEDILRERVRIETLAERRPVIETLAAELTARKAELASAEDLIAAAAREGGLAAGAPLPAAPLRRRARALLESGRSLTAEKARHRTAQREAEAERDALAATVPEVANAARIALRAALDAFPADAEARLAAFAIADDRAARGLAALLDALAPWSGTIEQLAKAVPPGPAETARHAAIVDDARRTLVAARSDAEKAEKDAIAQRRTLAVIAAGSPLPTPEIVATARAGRDALLADVRTRLSTPARDDDDRIGAALGEAVDHADRLADRRDADAARIAQHLQATFVLDEATALHEAAGRQIAQVSAALAAAEQDWAAALTLLGFARAVPPADLDRWRSDRDRALAAQVQCDDARLARVAFAAEISAAQHLVAQAFAAAGGLVADDASTAVRLSAARALAATLDAQAQAEALADAQREANARTREKHAGEARALAERAERIGAERIALLAELGLDARLDDAALGDALDAFDAIDRQDITRADLARRIESGQAEIARFDAEVDALLTDLRRAATDRRAEAVRGLVLERDAAVKAAETIARLTQETEAAETALTEVGRRGDAAAAIVATLIAAAAVEDEEALAPAIRASADAAALRAEQARLEQELALHGDGLPIDRLEADAAALPADTAAAEQSRIEERRREIEQAREEVGRVLADVHAEMGRAAAATAAADAQQEVVAATAEMAEAAESFVQSAAAAALLRWAIDRHRATSQAPLMAAAGTLFAQVTGGAFSGLVLDYGDDDRPAIKGLRMNGSRVAVDGMSEGTRDQLYLSLRLGAIGLRAGDRSLPIVCDDLLITADDGRAARMLTVLAAAASRAQVILFSHHEHMIDVARNALGSDGFTLHRLDPAAGARQAA